MVVLRQRIEINVELNDRTYRLAVTREFAVKWLCRRKISDSEFFAFVHGNGDFLAQLARRKIHRGRTDGDHIVIDCSDLPY
jgi:hypothetical protein